MGRSIWSYCPSVLEHTHSHGAVPGRVAKGFLEERQRVWRSSFRCHSQTGNRIQMRMDDLDRLLGLLDRRWSTGLRERAKSWLSDPAIVTSHSVNPDLLPWRGPPLIHRLKSSLANRRLVRWPPLLTFCCLSGAESVVMWLDRQRSGDPTRSTVRVSAGLTRHDAPLPVDDGRSGDAARRSLRGTFRPQDPHGRGQRHLCVARREHP